MLHSVTVCCICMLYDIYSMIPVSYPVCKRYSIIIIAGAKYTRTLAHITFLPHLVYLQRTRFDDGKSPDRLDISATTHSTSGRGKRELHAIQKAARSSFPICQGCDGLALPYCTILKMRLLQLRWPRQHLLRRSSRLPAPGLLKQARHRRRSGSPHSLVGRPDSRVGHCGRPKAPLSSRH